jgi:general stress protein 26
MAQNGPQSREDAIRKLRSLMEDINICMLTTVDADGRLHSRPMAVQKAEFDGDLWFLTGKSTGKTGEIRRDQHVNVSFADEDDQRYVSISGTATVLDDRDKIKQLWKPLYKAWFPKGLDDPDLTALKVTVEKAEYGDSPNGVATQLFGFLKAVTTGNRGALGEHEKVTL